MIQMLLTQPLEEHDLSCLERIGSGGAPLAVEVAHELERRFPAARCARATAAPRPPRSSPPAGRRAAGSGSVGKAVGGIEIRITGPDGEAAAGRAGRRDLRARARWS
jgi:acyl-coenzyme A synthetase/AMP-(fatty) acid ligase